MFRSSRTFPGQAYDCKACIASSVNGTGFHAFCAETCAEKCSIRNLAESPRNCAFVPPIPINSQADSIDSAMQFRAGRRQSRPKQIVSTLP